MPRGGEAFVEAAARSPGTRELPTRPDYTSAWGEEPFVLEHGAQRVLHVVDPHLPAPSVRGVAAVGIRGHLSRVGERAPHWPGGDLSVHQERHPPVHGVRSARSHWAFPEWQEAQRREQSLQSRSSRTRTTVGGESAPQPRRAGSLDLLAENAFADQRSMGDHLRARRGSRNNAPVLWEHVPRVWNSVPASRNHVRALWNSVRVSRNSVRALRNSVQVPWNSVRVSRNSVRALRNSVRALWNSVRVSRNSVRALRNSVPVPWNSVRASWNGVLVAPNTVPESWNTVPVSPNAIRPTTTPISA